MIKPEAEISKSEWYTKHQKANSKKQIKFKFQIRILHVRDEIRRGYEQKRSAHSRRVPATLFSFPSSYLSSFPFVTAEASQKAGDNGIGYMQWLEQREPPH